MMLRVMSPLQMARRFGISAMPPAISWIVSLVLVVSGLLDLGAPVICIGPNGHVDLEFNTAECCLSGPRLAETPVVPASAASAADCGGCVDLRAAKTALARDGGRWSPQQPMICEAWLQGLVGPGLPGIDAALASGHHCRHEILSSLSSVVLLI